LPAAAAMTAVGTRRREPLKHSWKLSLLDCASAAGRWASSE